MKVALRTSPPSRHHRTCAINTRGLPLSRGSVWHNSR
jgi:hypothetical protein